jgi:hypothetical protein
MLFTLNKRNSIVLRPEAIKLVPAFKDLTKDEQLFMILFMDYHSPYHQLPDRERLEKCLRHVYKTRNKKIPKHVTEACEKYSELQYDERRAMITVFQQKIQLLKQRFERENDSKLLIELTTTMEKLQKRCEVLQREINFDEQTDAVLYGRDGKSLIEIFQENKRLSEMRQESTFPDVKILYEPIETGEKDGTYDNIVGPTDI